jgi:Vacuolar sorting protein 9 (VPS9) domain
MDFISQTISELDSILVSLPELTYFARKIHVGLTKGTRYRGIGLRAQYFMNMKPKSVSTPPSSSISLDSSSSVLSQRPLSDVIDEMATQSLILNPDDYEPTRTVQYGNIVSITVDEGSVLSILLLHNRELQTITYVTPSALIIAREIQKRVSLVQELRKYFELQSIYENYMSFPPILLLSRSTSSPTSSTTISDHQHQLGRPKSMSLASSTSSSLAPSPIPSSSSSSFSLTSLFRKSASSSKLALAISAPRKTVGSTRDAFTPPSVSSISNTVSSVSGIDDSNSILIAFSDADKALVAVQFFLYDITTNEGKSRSTFLSSGYVDSLNETMKSIKEYKASIAQHSSASSASSLVASVVVDAPGSGHGPSRRRVITSTSSSSSSSSAERRKLIIKSSVKASTVLSKDQLDWLKSTSKDFTPSEQSNKLTSTSLPLVQSTRRMVDTLTSYILEKRLKEIEPCLGTVSKSIDFSIQHDSLSSIPEQLSMDLLSSAQKRLKTRAYMPLHRLAPFTMKKRFAKNESLPGFTFAPPSNAPLTTSLAQACLKIESTLNISRAPFSLSDVFLSHDNDNLSLPGLIVREVELSLFSPSKTGGNVRVSLEELASNSGVTLNSLPSSSNATSSSSSSASTSNSPSNSNNHDNLQRSESQYPLAITNNPSSASGTTICSTVCSHLLVSIQQLIDPESSETMRTKLRYLFQKPQDFFNISKNLQRKDDWRFAVHELMKIEATPTPSGKVGCLIATANAIFLSYAMLSIDKSNELVDESISQPTSSSNGAVIGADDFFPIFVYIIVQAKLENPLLMKEFMWSLCDRQTLSGQGGYYLTVFDAALEYIKTVN